MLIAPTGFDGGAEFEIVAETAAERTLLKACEDSEILSPGDDEDRFVLILPVSN